MWQVYLQLHVNRFKRQNTGSETCTHDSLRQRMTRFHVGTTDEFQIRHTQVFIKNVKG